MKQQSPGIFIGLIAAIILGFGIVAGVWLGLRSTTVLGYEPGVLQATRTGPNTATLNLSTFPDSHVCHPNALEPQSDWVTYCNSTSLEVPPNSTITVIIKNYDSATPLYDVSDGYFRRVQGTVAGEQITGTLVTKTTAAGQQTEKVNGQTFSQVDSSAVSHTFTIQSTPNSANPLFVSVPVVGVPDSANPNAEEIDGNPYPAPNIIQFQFQTGPAGTYIWKCYDPCGGDRGDPWGFGGPMATTGYMAGTLTVASY